MCKHVAAVLYGVGARLDQSPELLFLLRSVNHEELITQAAAATDLTARATTGGSELSESEMGSVFGIELDTQTAAVEAKPSAPVKTRSSALRPSGVSVKARRPAQPGAPAKAKGKPGKPPISKNRPRKFARRQGKD
jgi:uncharacterized Zn finger protein